MERVIKYSRPTVYDIHPRGQIWVAELEEATELYIQISKIKNDDCSPIWRRLGEYFESHASDQDIEALMSRADWHNLE